jgi:cytochrome c-type biogenesis protein
MLPRSVNVWIGDTVQEWINQALETPGVGITLLAALLFLGLLSAAASACCSLPVIGAIAGYVGASESNRKRDIKVAALSFVVGSVLALAVIGAAMGLAGQLVGESFGRYSKLVVGLVLVLFGLISLGLFPFKLPSFRFSGKTNARGALGAVILGSALGGSTATCAVSCCSPALLAILGVVALRGQVAKGALVMAVFGLGFSIPMVAVLLGASLGSWVLKATRIMPVVKVVGGLVMLGVGFYFLVTI